MDEAAERPSTAVRVVDGILSTLLTVVGLLTAFVMLSLFLVPQPGGVGNGWTVLLGNLAALLAVLGVIVGWLRFARRRLGFWVMLLGIVLAVGVALIITQVIWPTLPQVLPPVP